MHGLVIVNLALAGLAAHVLAHSVPPPVSPLARRKTFGFGPDLPHTRFESTDIHASVDTTKDAYAVARDFLSHYDNIHAARAYVIRPDSYTDHATGVTHIYALKDGRVLSFGDSFFTGELDHPPHVPVHPHAHHCAQLSSALDFYRSLLESLGSPDRTRVTHGLPTLEHLYASNCANVPSFSSIADPGEVDMDPRRPLLAFLASALPENHPAFSSLDDKLEEHVNNIILTPETHLLGDHASSGMSLSNVPGAVSDVKARTVWVQVTTEHGVKLELVHRFEVELEHNWYETTCDNVVTPSHYQRRRLVGQLPNLGAFVPPGSNFESVASAPVQGPGEAPSGKEGKCECVSQIPELDKASYLVFPWGTNDPVDAAQRKAAKHGEPSRAEYPLSFGRDFIKELGDTIASPAGWHTLPVSHDPSINDVDIEEILPGAQLKQPGVITFSRKRIGKAEMIGCITGVPHADGVFSYPYSPKPAFNEFESLEQARAHINASVTQLFYTSNMIHDLFYRYGFTETAGNFQQYNFGEGGEEGDAIIADAQDMSGFNNAAFTSPPDGLNGRCHMCLWDTDSPYPDGAMEASIVIHELSHGLSMRLTGGPKDSGCLGWGESGGMGEGWGDFIAVTVRSTSTYSDYPVGAWAANVEEGVRHYPYSTDLSVNPTTYETPNEPGFFGPHALGEVWAEMLWVIQQRLTVKHGFSDTLFPPTPNPDGILPPNDFYRPQTFNPHSGLPNPLVPKHGNTLLLQLVINGMKMQPCLPSFFDARAAIIDADKVLTGGENVCDIWQVFAERGLGTDARLIGTTPWGGGLRENGFRVPPRCRSGDSEPEPSSESDPTSKPDDHEPLSLWYLFKICTGKWISRLIWAY
ncbi:Fungalysin metallopeptidase-domain-containing protein [Boletus coccyginus]|nr:Fungalysin metallopeptidase-domain-containing protein [Boletus coccyginus]